MKFEEMLSRLTCILDGDGPDLFSTPVENKPRTYYYKLRVDPQTTIAQYRALMSQMRLADTRELIAAELSRARPSLRMQQLGQVKQIVGEQDFDLATYVSHLHCLKAETWMAERNWTEARANIIKALAASPKLDQPRDMLVAVYFEMKEYERAITYLKQCVKRDPDQCVKLYRLATHFHTKKLMKNAAKAYKIVRDLDEDGIFHDLATDQLRLLTSSAPDPPDLDRLAEQAQDAPQDIDNGDAKRALNKLLAFLAWAPERGQIWYLVGYVYQQLLASRETEDLHPTKTKTVVRVFEKSNKSCSYVKRAAQAYQAATIFCPDLTEAHHQLANCWMAIERPEAAVTPAQIAVQLEPDNAFFLGTLGAVLLENDNVVEAEKVIRKALAVNPRDWLTHIALAKTLARLSKYDEAQSHFGRAAVIRSESGQS